MNFLSKLALLSLLLAAPGLAAEAGREPPAPVRTVAPEYPSDLRRNGVSGMVMVKCTIDEQGNVTDPEVVKSSNVAFRPARARRREEVALQAREAGRDAGRDQGHHPR